MILQAHKIEKYFLQGEKKISVLKGLDLNVESGETIAIIGKSGAGKSTLLSLLAGLDHSNQGSLNILGQNIFNMPENELALFRAKNLGIVFQNYHLLPHLTALENVALPMEILNQTGAIERAQYLLEQVGLKERMDHIPEKLSGGENQRVAVARALSASPAVVLADEPSGSLDEETGIKVIDLLFDLIRKENKILILVTHDLDLAKRCHRQLILEQGQLRAFN